MKEKKALAKWEQNGRELPDKGPRGQEKEG